LTLRVGRMTDIKECLKARITHYSRLVTHNPHHTHVMIHLYMEHPGCCSTHMYDEVSSHTQLTLLLRMFVYHLAASLTIFEFETFVAR